MHACHTTQRTIFHPGRLLMPETRSHHRRSIRLRGYDYTQAGWYYVTLVTQERACLFDTPLFRQVAETAWQHLPQHFPGLLLDAWILMPDHLHGVLTLTVDGPDGAGATQPANSVPHGSLGAIIGTYKAITTRRLNHIRQVTGRQVWQRNYYEHVIRSEPELQAIRQYIRDNPARWELAGSHPANR